MRRLAILTLLLLASLVRDVPQAATSAGPYVLTDLGTLAGLQSAQANDLNETGQVVGHAANRPFRWENGVITDLGTLGGNTGGAAAINEAGQMVGASATPTGSRATLWDGSAIVNLTPLLGAGEWSTASGLNDAGDVVGNVNSKAFVWENGNLTMLPHLGGVFGSATDINHARQIVGASYTTVVTQLGNMPHAVLWQDGGMTDLGVLPGDEDSSATAINELGQIVGSSGRTDPDTYETMYRPFIYENGVMTAVPVNSGESYAADINDHRVVVGTMRAGGGPSKYHAFIYADGVVTNLNTLIPAGSGLHLAYAQSINNAGQIVGVAFDSQLRYHAFLLTPMTSGTPIVNIGDASVNEGHSGTRTASFTVSLSSAAAAPVTVAYTTANASATAGTDYGGATGSVTFDAGETSKTIAISVNGDRAGEPNETFVTGVSITSGGAILGDAQGIGTIVDDEPRISISSATKNEGNSGTTPFVFTVSLSTASDAPVSVGFATADGSARAPGDYTALAGSLTFAAGTTSKTVTIGVKGDRMREWQEVFYVNLSNAAGALIQTTQGTGVVRNDDR
jgi:probable HAF family extracellular repeat protein